MGEFVPLIDIRRIYDDFDASITGIDCGKMCAPHNPTGKPFCCDICQAVPAAYRQEWDYLRLHTDLWHEWRGDECTAAPEDPANLQSQTPDNMQLLACKGPQHCQREFRSISCRQFPFFPYVTADYRFLGLAYYWEFEPTCWVISNLGKVTDAYRQSFIRTYDELFAIWDDEFESYANYSEDMREYFMEKKRRIPILHRNGGYYLLSPRNERLQRVNPEHLPKFRFYKG
jgi:hypothetical protein